MINDSIEVSKTDIDGFFEAEIPIPVDKLLFKGIGLDPATIEITDNCNKLEVVMMYTFTYDFISLKRVDKKRKKRYKKLPEIYKTAIDKGIFEMIHPCYIRDFEPY
ncbi:hypothetical protein HHU12_25080 [Flammeovirga aprica JL-4]|uniref:Uncharacterized protein n=2 Tax=Flammeovirga aprica TaxID=29528 RepID=A0A7X9XC12_9BACT|nr:hypothetical protein [Flammeovirga aprica JL-4]